MLLEGFGNEEIKLMKEGAILIGIACLTLIVVVTQCCRRRLTQEYTYTTSTADQVVLPMIHIRQSLM